MSHSEAKARRRINWFNARYLILAAALWHVGITLTVFLIGKYRLFPNQVDPVGLSVGSDAQSYQGDCIILGYVLRNDGFREWLTWPTQLHVRLYSLPLMPVFRRAGFNVLTIEPLNLIYYLVILVLVCKLGETIFDHESGLLAAGIVAVWPTLLFHTTQLFRDPLLIVAVLVVSYTFVKLLSQRISWVRGSWLAIAAVAAIAVIRIVRLPMWYTLCAAIAFGSALLIFQFARQRRLRTGVVGFAVVVILAMLVVPRYQSVFHNQQQRTLAGPQFPEATQELSLLQQIELRRKGFQNVDENGEPLDLSAGTTIDADAQFKTFGDLVRYLPRALVIGLFSPFPNMWFATGRQVGRIGRVLTGGETFITYGLEGLALVGLWYSRRQLAGWFLMGFAAVGALSLGLVAANIGALYRLRYPFWLMMTVVGAGGAMVLLRRYRQAPGLSAEKACG